MSDTIRRPSRAWYAFLADLGDLGVCRDHMAHVLARVAELVRVGAAESHIEALDSGSVAFTWSDGTRYRCVCVAPDGTTRCFADDGVVPAGSTHPAGDPLPQSFLAALA